MRTKLLIVSLGMILVVTTSAPGQMPPDEETLDEGPPLFTAEEEEQEPTEAEQMPTVGVFDETGVGEAVSSESLDGVGGSQAISRRGHPIARSGTFLCAADTTPVSGTPLTLKGLGHTGTVTGGIPTATSAA